MSTVPATLDQNYLNELSGMVNQKAAVANQYGPALLKINYEAVNCEHERGCWVVGQKKKDNVITEQGKKVAGMIILTTRLQYNCYHKDHPNNFYTSTFYTWSERAPKDKGVVDAKVLELGLEKAQNRIVAVGLAICEDGEEVPCIAYMKGKTWMPFREHLDTITKVNGATGVIEVPEYTFVTNFPQTITEQNGSNIFYVGVFERGAPVEPDKARELYAKAEEAHEWIDQVNRGKLEKLEEKNQTAAPVRTPPAATMPPVSTMGDDAFIEPDYQVTTSQAPVQQPAPANPAPQAGDPGPATDPMADLEAEINAVL